MDARRSPVVAALCIGALAMGGCRGPQRPSAGEWGDEWRAAQRLVPDPGTLARPPSHETCEDVLGELREHRPELIPAPDDEIGAAAERWFEHAESMFFGCFDGSDGDADVRAEYDTLERLANEVEAALGA